MSTELNADVEAFLDLVCSDPDLLAAEFAAIVADCWDQPPAEPGRSPPSRPGPQHRPGRGPARPTVPVFRVRRELPPVTRGRQRAPPSG